MRDYDIDEARDILKSQDPVNLKIIPHVEERWLERDFEINYTVDCLLNKVPLSISKTYHNRFKLIYPHETKSTMDLYVIIEISDNENVSIITVYPEEKKRREHERKH
ncbi:MAG: hypothetical protein IJH63_15790 [Methanobrevibacter sp.]|uniref:DUF4258 domain-containing protein n=1 Tax=Methanobrevibacter millerae TaxID=230361 RepID=A0A8T3VJ97_9EURY|nr:hypothetical protein [Methanobrevibacter millerae]MBE6504841.1 hypothetical protein [Methanobrevibacter millerae]MBR0058746.1 hypothetical protein [Methanobrevibacter sp.]MBR0372152.1 hypothetical protein [Methanobrevibacter sp.]